MTCYSRAFMPRGRHHFSAPWPLIMHPRVARLLVLFYSSLVSGPVILSAAGAKDLLSAVPDARPDSRTVARVRSLTPDPSLACRATTLPPWQPAGQQVLRSRAFRALAQDDSAARFGRRRGNGGSGDPANPGPPDRTSGGGFSLPLLRRDRACHPERRRR